MDNNFDCYEIYEYTVHRLPYISNPLDSSPSLDHQYPLTNMGFLYIILTPTRGRLQISLFSLDMDDKLKIKIIRINIRYIKQFIKV